MDLNIPVKNGMECTREIRSHQNQEIANIPIILREAVAFASGMAAREADESFPARVGPRCGWCEVRSGCGPGQAVPKQPPWAGVVESG